MNYCVDSINNYYQKDEFNKIVDEIYLLTKHLNKIYPEYKKWFYDKQIKGCLNGKRNILFIKNENEKIIGMSSLKKDNYEKKICTLFVKEEYRNKGYGNLLLEKSLSYLETINPLVTIAEENIFMFEKIIKKYDWKLTDIRKNGNVCEYVYNKNTN